jgi:hypothetical protein
MDELARNIGDGAPYAQVVEMHDKTNIDLV